jgi:crotonobetainyl-CoA:carnitine CoA-transferase CaiB-like acyl-CoA transferase
MSVERTATGQTLHDGWLPENSGALGDLKVLDFTQFIAGPFCAKLFADYGADVLKIEPPAGDGGRRLAPFVDDEVHLEKSALFCYMNTNKRSITLDLKTASGQRIVRELAAGADVVIENFMPGVMPRLGLSWEAVHSLNPRCTMVSISNFGQTGPYRDYEASDLVVFAMGGEMYSMGRPDREPVKQGGTAALYQSAAVTAAAAMGAVLGQRRGNTCGQYVDISMFETHLAGTDRRAPALLAYSFSGRVNRRIAGSGLGYPSGVYRCKDGFIDILGGGPWWGRIVRLLGNPESLRDARWTAPGAQQDPELEAEFHAIFNAWLAERTKREIWQLAQEARVLAGPLFTVEDLLADDHFRERGFWAEVTREFVGRQTMPGRPFIMSETPWEVRRPAPTLGQHTASVLDSLGYTRDEIIELRQTHAI